MEENFNNNDKILILLLNQLSQIQAQIAAIISTRFDRQTSENVQNKVDDKEDVIIVEAERYGQSPEKAEPALVSYKQGLNQVRDEYSNEKNGWIAQSQEFELREFETAIKIKELEDKLKVLKAQQQIKPQETQPQIAIYENEIATKKENLLNDRESSKQSKENIKDCKNRCDSKINEIADDRSLVPKDEKMNIFQKLFSKIKDKIAGKGKFESNVIEPLKSKATYIKEEVVPKVKEEIQQNVIPKLKELFEKGKEKVQELNLPEKFQNLMSKAKEGAQSIVSKCSGLKEVAVKAFDVAKEGVSKVAEKITEKVADVTER